MKKSEIIELCGGGYTARINLSRGANCISLRHSATGARILREPPDPMRLDNPYLYGMPLLFPVNRIFGGRFVFRGREYVFPVNEPNTGCHLHGTLHETPFAVTARSGDSLTAEYTADAAHPYLSFPHAFTLRLSYCLEADGLHLETALTNRSDTDMPYFLGFHTTFSLAMTPKTNAEAVLAKAELSREIERDMTTYLPTGRLPEFDAVSAALAAGTWHPASGAISRHYRAGGGGLLTLTDPETGLRMVYRNDAAFGYRLIYGDGKAFLCMEPQTCMANAANAPFAREETGFAFLRPDETKQFHSQIGLEEIGI